VTSTHGLNSHLWRNFISLYPNRLSGPHSLVSNGYGASLALDIKQPEDEADTISTYFVCLNGVALGHEQKFTFSSPDDIYNFSTACISSNDLNVARF
jgi:hypothetical protein